MKDKDNSKSIIGIEEKNPVFTISCHAGDPGKFLIFFGSKLLETVPNTEKDPVFKLIIARVYSAGAKAVTIKRQFGIDRKTIKNWAEALECGDPKRLVRVMKGPGGLRKLTPEIRSFIETHFPEIYRKTHYNYSAKIKEEIYKTFNVRLSSETLRPLLKRLKEEINRETSYKEKVEICRDNRSTSTKANKTNIIGKTTSTKNVKRKIYL